MSPFTLLLATPVFGLTLTLDPAAIDASPALSAGAPVVMDLAPATVAEDAEEEGEPTVAELMARRAHFGRIHKIMGLTTWASMTVTVALGWFQYINLYGFFADREDTRCATGDAFFGQGACTHQPLPHLISSATTGALYYTTFALSYFMPDPLHLSEGNSESARELRRHKRLRWAHFGGMAAQILLGALVANAQGLGLDRANDYRALQALATVHFVTGLATYATLTWAGTIMTF
jgi:hypothetical protein